MTLTSIFKAAAATGLASLGYLGTDPQQGTLISPNEPYKVFRGVESIDASVAIPAGYETKLKAMKTRFEGEMKAALKESGITLDSDSPTTLMLHIVPMTDSATGAETGEFLLSTDVYDVVTLDRPGKPMVFLPIYDSHSTLTIDRTTLAAGSRYFKGEITKVVAAFDRANR
ncbi:hypothetical protein EON79_09270 [bacterium]|nr:MAG: hypothetical protein EON79_09270 [bacterium]